MAKETINDYPNFTLKGIPKNKHHALQWRRFGRVIARVSLYRLDARLIIIYKQGDAIKHEEITIAQTPCNYGGARDWLVCPKCHRRVTTLYGIPFICRHCRHLAYPTTRMGELDLMTERMDKIRDKLKWEQGILNGNGSRPKGMHKKTYARLLNKYHDMAEATEKMAFKRFGINLSDYF